MLARLAYGRRYDGRRLLKKVPADAMRAHFFVFCKLQFEVNLSLYHLCT